MKFLIILTISTLNLLFGVVNGKRLEPDLNWPSIAFWEVLPLDEVLPNCIKQSGINQDLIDEFYHEDNVDRFVNNKQLRDMLHCALIEAQLVDPTTGKYNYSVLIKLYDALEDQWKLLLVKLGAKCYGKKPNNVAVDDFLWQTMICMKRVDPVHPFFPWTQRNRERYILNA